MESHEQGVLHEGAAEKWDGNELSPFEVEGHTVRAWTTNVTAGDAPAKPLRNPIRWEIDIADVGSFLAFEWHPADTHYYVRQRAASAARVFLRSKAQNDA